MHKACSQSKDTWAHFTITIGKILMKFEQLKQMIVVVDKDISKSSYGVGLLNNFIAKSIPIGCRAMYIFLTACSDPKACQLA
eukprot:6186140-Pleurochrysis_carterae.AAC.1